MSTYNITSPGIDGIIKLHYFAGHLTSVEMEIKQPLNFDQWRILVNNLYYRESSLKEKGMAPLVVEELAAPKASNEKIAMFCNYYKNHSPEKNKYKVSPADSGKIKYVDVNDLLLTTYFRSENFLFKNKYSISNFVKYYNELVWESTKKPGVQYPNYWTAEYEYKLPTKERPAFWKHLRSLGLNPVKKAGKTLEWK